MTRARASLGVTLFNASTCAVSLALFAATFPLGTGCSAGSTGGKKADGPSAGGASFAGASGASGVGPSGAGGTLMLDAGVGQGGTGHPGGGACGDGVIQRSEGCDDANTTNGDGCSRICQLEANWRCPMEGKPCEYLGVC